MGGGVCIDDFAGGEYDLEIGYKRGWERSGKVQFTLEVLDVIAGWAVAWGEEGDTAWMSSVIECTRCRFMKIPPSTRPPTPMPATRPPDVERFLE